MTDHSKPLPPNFLPPRPDLVLFDWDGTLSDSFALLYAAYNHVAGHLGMERFTHEQVRLNTRRSARDLFPEIFGERAVQASQLFYAYVRSHHLDHLSPVSGADDCLSFLFSKNIRMGVVSNMNHELLLHTIERLGWNRYFSVVLGAGQARRDKPAPDPLLLACERSKVDLLSETVWYVGDTETDMMAARDAGVVPVFIGHGARKLADCHAIGIYPYSIDNFNSLLLNFSIIPLTM